MRVNAYWTATDTDRWGAPIIQTYPAQRDIELSEAPGRYWRLAQIRPVKPDGAMAGLRANAPADNIRDDATIGFDAEGRVLSASSPAATALGYSSSEDLHGLALSSLIGDDAARVMLSALRSSADDHDEFLDEEEIIPSGPVAFRKRDGSSVAMQTVVTPETSGGWITLVGTAREQAETSAHADPSARDTIRRIARSASIADSEESLASQVTRDLREALSVETVIIARSTAAPGLYDPVAIDSDTILTGLTDSFELPSPLIPEAGGAPVAIESAERLALFEPAVIGGSELSGGYLATRIDIDSGAHLLVIAVDGDERQWADNSSFTCEATAALVSSSLQALSLRGRVAAATRSTETIRQVGLLASKDGDDSFLADAQRMLARRIPVAALSATALDAVTSRCQVISSSTGYESPLHPEPEWGLGASLEQQVLRTGSPVVISASSREMVSVQPSLVAHWRKSGLQAVVAIPLREHGRVAGALIAGFATPLENRQDTVRLLEAVVPAVQIGVGVSGSRLSAAKQSVNAAQDPGHVEPELLLALTRAASESPDTETLFASVTEWLLEIISSSRVRWGVIRHGSRSYRRIFTYEPASAGLPESSEETQLSSEEFEDLKAAGLGLAEPGQAGGESQSMRCAVIADQRTVGVITVWPQDGESFSMEDLSRLERVCDFVAGPLSRIIETETVREAQVARDQVAMIGAQMASFFEPAQAFRSIKSQLARLLPNDRIVFLEFDHGAGIARAVYDSSAPPVPTAKPQETLISALPAPAIASAQEPIIASLNGSESPKGGPLFAGLKSLLSVPVTDTDGTAGALLFLKSSPDAYSSGRRDIAVALSSHLTGAFATWQAYRSSKEWTNELRETRKQLNSILGSAPVALINIDSNGVCTRLEGHGLDTLGIHREDMLGKSIFELTGKMPQLEDAIRQGLRGIPASANTALGTRAAEIWAQPVIGGDGTVSGVTVVGYDVSERIRSQRARSEVRELQSVNRERTRFVSAVSHELRNPLQSIMFYADILSADATDSLTTQQAKALAVIQNSSERLDALINDLLDLSRLDTGDFGLELSTVDVSAFLREIIDAQKPMFEGAGQSLEIDAPDSAGAVQADQLRLTQVLTNLLSNASKFCPEGTTVSVAASTQGTNVRISVADTGPGIPKDHMDKVFDAGYRVESEQTRSVPGTGLGLAIARRITELHGGKIALESEPGKGTKVTITLPVYSVESEPAGETKSPAPQTKRRRPRAKAG